jgi:hypothetical protein
LDMLENGELSGIDLPCLLNIIDIPHRRARRQPAAMASCLVQNQRSPYYH